MNKKCLLLLLDGLGDRAYPELDYKTPLEYAQTPNLDLLASIGSNGLLHAGQHGKALPSENAHFAMFGYDDMDFPGRGALEAIGAGVGLSQDDVAILAHFIHAAKQENCLVLEQEKPEATDEEVKELVCAINPFVLNGMEISYHITKKTYGVLVVKGWASQFVTDSDPIIINMPVMLVQPFEAFCNEKVSILTADFLNSYLIACHHILEKHPVNIERIKKGNPSLNMVVFQRPGRLKPVVRFQEKWGLKGLSISSGLVYWGLCSFIGMDVLKAKESGSTKNDIKTRIEEAVALLEHYDFIHVHTKAPDEAGHTKDPFNKVREIEALDKGVGECLELLIKRQDIVLIITSDHSTPCTQPLIHSGEPVPICIVGENIRRDAVRQFDEISCGHGALGWVNGKDFMPIVLNCLDKSKLRGLMDTPVDQPYWPGNRKPLLCV